MIVNGIKVDITQSNFSMESKKTIWLHDLQAHMSRRQWKNLDTYLRDGWNPVEVSFTTSTGMINRPGVHAYKQEKNMVDVLSDLQISKIEHIFIQQQQD
ncbi:TMV resistance protein N-like [Quillaja saponaria]|uniref:TMV resistance protein N-like n=1 Tax=Quillaja saponaria TaxID=32244 RepID=A0AAD7M5U1_QUISA|nr:TMV resistance protein N-like [Quillaja saponaria]